MAENKDNLKDEEKVEKADGAKKPVAKKPVAAKPTTAKKPAAAKPATAKPATAKSTAAKPATAKSSATKSTAAKPAAKKPAAKPVTEKAEEVKPEAVEVQPAEAEVVVAPAEVQPVEAAPVQPVVEAQPAQEATAPAEVAPVEVQHLEVQPAEEVKSDRKPTFINKVSGFFVDKAKTVKGWFVKDKSEEVTVVAADGTVISSSTAMQTVYSGNTLSKKERVIRFCRSQSGWLFVLPAVALLCIFTLYPIVNAFIRAFMNNYQPTFKKNPYDGWGFSNFKAVLTGVPERDIGGLGGLNFWQCLLNTFIVTIISVPLSIIVALFIAVALNSIKAVRKAYQTVLFLPYLTNALAMGAVFATFFQIVGTQSATQTKGLINDLLGLNIDWLNPHAHAWGSGEVKFYWASYLAMIIYDVWAGLPFKILILFSSLQNVNKQYYDAAKVDGASKPKILVKITAPLISPMLSYLFITGIMGGMKAYSSVVGLFGVDMGTDFAMGTMVGYIYKFLEKGATGYAFAGSLVLFVIIMIITAISNYVSKRHVTYA